MAKGIYVGVTEEETLIAFTSNPVPTAWDGTSLTSDTATNDYGIWKITASSTNVNAVENAFDNSTSTVWQSGSSASVNYVTLNCPTDITIKPTEISIKYKNFANLSAIEGQRSSGEWINLATLERKTSETTTTFNIDTGEYYKAIRIVANQINSSYAYQYLYDFKINSGTIKKAGKTNIARKVKKAYVGVAEDSLITNGDFSNGLEGWENLHPTYETMEVVTDNGENALKVTITQSIATAVISQTISSINTSSIYYFCCLAKGDVNNSTNAKMWYPINLCGSSSSLPNIDVTGSEYVFTSQRSTVSNTGDSSWQTLRLYSKGSSAVGNIYYYKDIRLYDLTALYGSGNEPTKEWCDANLETLKTLYKSKNSKARKVKKVKKGYIGVNGVARLFYNYIEPQTITSFSTPNFTSAKYTDEFGSEWTLSPATAYAAWDKNGDTYFSGSASSTVRLTLTLPDGYYLTPKKFYYQMRYCDWTLYGVTADGTEYSIATGGNGGTGMVNSSTDISFSNQREYVKFYLDISSYNGSNIPQMWMAYFGSSILRIG